ncbi:LAQU0S44e00100g1_1 [Lachancea quebecensis]|uniref:LAQU0S44e00100g1_1 n=1 Tax=Lachancea quebecensis TaxID=1654605 RepID=A0A0P1KYC2_9SACH|nr:LAQU0S44e00100g1_1 [Lachancea quebecensis]
MNFSSGQGPLDSNSSWFCGHGHTDSSCEATARTFDIYAYHASLPAHMMDVVAGGSVDVDLSRSTIALHNDENISCKEKHKQSEEHYNSETAEIDFSPLAVKDGNCLNNNTSSELVKTMIPHNHVKKKREPLNFVRHDFLKKDIIQLPLQAMQPPPKKLHLWSKVVEKKFLSALRIIPKKSPSKNKLRDRSYGRNELISLYIHHHIGEYRSKKQISSHIQVRKNFILNKQQNGKKITSQERELIELIDYGPLQIPENEYSFYAVFNEILDSTYTSNRTHFTHLPSQGTVVHGFPNVSIYDSCVSNPANTEPPSALECAHRFYSELHSLKCIAVNTYDYTYPYCEALSFRSRRSNRKMLKAAKKVEVQQRQLIQKLYASQHSSVLAKPSKFGSDQPEYSGYDSHSFVPPKAAQPPSQYLSHAAEL